MSNVTFKCKATGNTVTFRDEADIVGMRKHTEYEEVSQAVSKEEESLPVVEQSFSEPKQPVLMSLRDGEQRSAAPVTKRGRPSKKV